MENSQDQLHAEFMLPGLIFPEPFTRKTNTSNPLELEIPESAFSLIFFQFDEKCERKNIDPRYYIGSRLYTAAEMEEETKADEEKLHASALHNREMLIEEAKESEFADKKNLLKCQVGGFVKLDPGEAAILIHDNEMKVVIV